MIFMNQTYQTAVEVINAAYAVYCPIRDAYKAGKIDNMKFIAAKTTYDAATEVYNAAVYDALFSD